MSVDWRRAQAAGRHAQGCGDGSRLTTLHQIFNVYTFWSNYVPTGYTNGAFVYPVGTFS